MDAETISLIIKWGPLALIGVVFVWCFILGVIRGTYKVVRRMSYALLFVGLLWIFMIPITTIILDLNVTINGVQGVRTYIVDLIESNDTIAKFLSYSPDLKYIIIDSPEIVIAPILFIVLVLVGLPLSLPLYWVYILFYNMIAKLVFKRRKYEVGKNGEVLRNERGKKIRVVRKKHRLLGGFLRGTQGVILVCVVLLPVNFINRIYNKAKSNAELANGETLCTTNSSLEEYKDICAYMDVYNETIFAKLGGESSLDKVINDRLTTIEHNGKEFNLENELSSVVVSAVLLNDSGIMELFKDGEFNLDEADFSKINFDKLSLLVDNLFSSTLVSELSVAGTKYVLNEVLDDKLVDLLKDDEIVSKLEYENADQIKQELKDVVDILKFAVEKNLDDSIIDNKDNAVAIVNSVNAADVETLLNKILSLRILNKAMPSAIKAYGEKYGVQVPSEMTSELNEEVANLLSQAIAFVHTMEITNLEDITEGDMVENISNALFENGALKSNSKESLATLLNDLNQSYLFKNVVSEQANKLLEGKDYKIDARVLKYVDSKESWLNELEVLEKAFALYDEYKETKVINYSNVTSLLNELSGTKVLISVLPFAYDELLPKVGLQIDSEGFPVIDFDGEEENASRDEFYATWEGELTLLRNIATTAGTLELQSLEDINLDLIKVDENVEALSTILGEVYKSELLKDSFAGFMVDTINEFVVDYGVEFTKDELLSIDNKDKWNNELRNISDVVEIDLSVEGNIDSTNLNKIFTAVGNMQLFKQKKIDILKTAIEQSEFLTNEEFASISWPEDDATQSEIDAFWTNETSVLVKVVDERQTIEDLSTLPVEEMDTNKVGTLVNEVMKSNILKSIVVNKVSALLVENDVKDDRDVGDETAKLRESIASVSDWKNELALIKDMVIISGDITGDNMGEVATGENKNTIEKLFDNIEESEILNNAKANLLLKAVETIDITDVPQKVTVDTLKADSYAQYENEKEIIITVSKNKATFDEVGNLSLENMDVDKVGGLLNTVVKSEIFKDYIVDQIEAVFVDADIRDDRDTEGDTTNLKNSIASVSEWKTELNIIKRFTNIVYYEEITNTNTYKKNTDGTYSPDPNGTYLLVDGIYNLIKASNRYDRSGTADNYTYTQADEGIYLSLIENDIEGIFASLDTSPLFKNTRANLLIKVVEAAAIDGVSIPNGVTVETLSKTVSGVEYAQYKNETNVLIKFAKNRAIVEDMSDVTSLKGDNKKAVATVLDAMKASVIMATKYTSTLNSALSTIKNNGDLKTYGVTFSSDYASVVWSSTYEEDGVTILKNGEIDNLLVINDNISAVAAYDEDSLIEDKATVIATVGKTLDAVSASSLLGKTQANIIADKVIQTLTGVSSATISDQKQATETWTNAFDRVLNPPQE